ncbi:MAG: endopeptidase La [SAR324 cluster bacterium]|uniref:Lon protease n=3 Tax=SAR324 cluster bacterium TaxID=2024889 RepID=A0A432H0S0_9DELT|nr:MAG: endopeptidase La [SAR324 cluster bacterium]RTZ89306.1 MAG: endopeptidase La [SAR324 cluster bacterium]
MSGKDQEKNTAQNQIALPMLPMRDIVVFPHMTAPFFIGRSLSIASLEKALDGDRQIFVVAQEDPLVEEPEAKDLFRVGTIGKVLQIMRLHNGTIKALFEAKSRGRLIEAHMEEPHFAAVVEPIPEQVSKAPELLALSKNVRAEFKRYLKDVKKRTEGIEKLSIESEEPHILADRIAPLLNMDLQKKQDLLENSDPKRRLEIVYGRMLEEKEFKKVERKLKERVQGQIGRTQKEYYLNEQVKAIQKELGHGEDSKAEMDEYAKKIEEIKLSDEAREMAEKELQKLKMMPSMSSEANVVRNYIDWLLSMPWAEKTEDNFDLEKAEKVLDAQHYGLEKVKERIIEYLAVAQQVGKMKGPIICLVGPPGVGKTSLARSVAEALGRKFARVSLGGIRDEAEIRGHRRTYIGAMPGKVIQSLRKTKFNNPLLLFDEIDKMSHGVMGDPAAALLEVLDPEQNHTFMDHYLEVEFDVSDVLFFCTANVPQNIPPALKDRMEVIRLSGYTELEKENIARKHLLPKQMDENGLTSKRIQFQQKAILKIIRNYTREAGVRNLEREIAKTCRKVATQLVKKTNLNKVVVTPLRVQKYLGVQSYKHGKAEEKNEIGTSCGLAWTQAGGELLVTEVNIMKGTGKLQLTGKLGDVMKESAQAALSYVRTNANQLGIFSSVFEKTDIHIHVPSGAVPKDGPSAGVTIATSIVSAFTSIPVRKEVAMTGETTLRGKVLAIGGLKEKLLAAKRGLISTVIMPHKNKKDLSEIPEEIQRGLEIIPVQTVEKVLEIALERMPIAVIDPEPEVEENMKVDSPEAAILPQTDPPESPRTYDA